MRCAEEGNWIHGCGIDPKNPSLYKPEFSSLGANRGWAGNKNGLNEQV